MPILPGLKFVEVRSVDGNTLIDLGRVLSRRCRQLGYCSEGCRTLDLDNDCVRDFLEIEQGTNPLDPGDHPDLFEYAAKLVCGVQRDPDTMRLARGFYATTINVRNPGPSPVGFCKELALTYPPGDQRPGKVQPIAEDQLGPGQALAADCDDIRRRVFDDSFPEPYIEGFVVIRSPRSLDVTAVYTTAALNAKGGVGDHSSIHVEPVHERLRRRQKLSLPDLVPVAPQAAGIAEGLPGTLFCVRPREGGASDSVRVLIRNQGLAAAGPSTTHVDFFALGSATAATPPLGPGEETPVDFEIPEGCYQGEPFSGVCVFRFTVDFSRDFAGVVSESSEENNSAESRCISAAG